ncbi:hypothetical protein COW36_16665 [bacterium (Candidatus Blackallbacteria) CG17_big_fil_post_rev_8_21_14_2_50_48_46]|uniref:Glycosyltransferase n=1 Tax=bacterium (Candidatus Blackallbacteria) CG17_big_fil_post_rev_8_21_14_2_50_48_46 TaxID=2014261 RepID=A0A2M7G1S2_9BACT|nr:MAG: hypothetical protein COW64_08200 [bacterium (Candidatus Blackallbacteria) CG18_big_fil_WC_8_21_14_2_50_49_26]PIW15581.1 MAG: hypothetical protein COW36_16665 [bacterium (Candidatus Blackallbacteria) CG17_big_fil_post_rev_8_21_14_2_50_48_46]PIW49372.1 MAG: hypothetical protein COW20_06095 [bacterium (Candidatus Blackallbacteria) CG13_big_fil_rev_8_21_14_2_50_49_14]
MKAEIHCLYWDNTDPRMVEAHQRVMRQFEIPVNYFSENLPHGFWMNEILRLSEADVIGFLDIDCVPLHKGIIFQLMNFAHQYQSFVGPAQVSNHLAQVPHVFAAPSCLFLSKKAYEQLGRPSLIENERADVAEELSFQAEAQGLRYRAMYPTRFEHAPENELWALGNYGIYGIGTLYDDQLYHLFQARFSQHLALFLTRCEQILEGRFDFSQMINARSFKYPEVMNK